MELEVGYIKLLSNQTLSRSSMLLETEKIKNVHSDLYGFQELTQAQET